jgi:hypothetical protein
LPGPGIDVKLKEKKRSPHAFYPKVGHEKKRSPHAFYPKVGHQFSGFFPTPDQNFTCFQRPPSEACVQTELGHKLGGSRPWFGQNIFGWVGRGENGTPLIC